MRILLLTALIMGCSFSDSNYGEEEYEEYDPPQQTNDDNNDASSDDDVILLSWETDIKPIVSEFCANCHSAASYVETELGFISSDSCGRIQNETMPPKNSPNYDDYSDEKQTALLQFCDQELLSYTD